MASTNQKVEAFLTACRFYKHNKEIQKQLEKKYPAFKEKEYNPDQLTLTLSSDISYGDDVLYQLVRRSTEPVETGLKTIKEQYGKAVSDEIKALFIEHETQEQTAQKFSISRRQLMYQVNKVLEEVFR